jgi:hypothetical protein
MRVALAALAALLALPVLAGAQSPIAPPEFHGVLEVLPTRGRIDPATGNSTFTIRRWRFLPSPDSNGIFPDQEPILIVVDTPNQLFIPAGLVKRSRNGRVFRYRPSAGGPPAVRSFRMMRHADGTYRVQLSVKAVPLEPLRTISSMCLSVAFIVGDDDAFKGAQFQRPGLLSPKLSIVRPCDPSGDGWPWLGS